MAAEAASALKQAAALRMRRGRLAEARLTSFARIYLPDRFDLPWCEMHGESGASLGAVGRGGIHLAVAAPQRSGKTSLFGLALPIWAAAFRSVRHIAILSVDKYEAQRRIAELDYALSSATQLSQDVRLARRCRSRSFEIELAGGATIIAAKMGAPWRTLRRAGRGPDLLILDDVEGSPEDARAEFMSRLAWLDEGMARELPKDGAIIVCGSIQHERSMLAELVDHATRPGWHKIAFAAVERFGNAQAEWNRWERIASGHETFDNATGPVAARSFYLAHRDAMDEGALTHWPEAFDIERMNAERLRLGKELWCATMLNDPGAHRVNYWRVRGGPVDPRYESTMQLFDEWDGARLYQAHDPDILNPQRDPSVSEVVVIREEVATGEREAVDVYVDRRKIRVRPLEALKRRIAREQAQNPPQS